jgi:hypothetical protein
MNENLRELEFISMMSFRIVLASYLNQNIIGVYYSCRLMLITIWSLILVFRKMRSTISVIILLAGNNWKFNAWSYLFFDELIVVVLSLLIRFSCSEVMHLYLNVLRFVESSLVILWIKLRKCDKKLICLTFWYLRFKIKGLAKSIQGVHIKAITIDY